MTFLHARSNVWYLLNKRTLCLCVLTSSDKIAAVGAGPGIHPVMPNPSPTAAILSKIVRTHKHKVRLFNKYHEVDRACKKFISKLIMENIYKSLLSCIIGFTKVTSLENITHLITKYAELEEEDVQYIDRKMKEPISGESLFEDFVEKVEWNQEAVAVQNPCSPAYFFSMAYVNIKKCGLYQGNCREWSRKTRSNKTLSNSKAHFDRSFQETQSSSRTLNTE